MKVLSKHQTKNFDQLLDLSNKSRKTLWKRFFSIFVFQLILTWCFIPTTLMIRQLHTNFSKIVKSLFPRVYMSIQHVCCEIPYVLHFYHLEVFHCFHCPFQSLQHCPAYRLQQEVHRRSVAHAWLE